VALRARDAGHEALVGQILIHPATCVPAFYPSDKFLLESMKENKNAPVLTAEDMQYFWGIFLKNKDLTFFLGHFDDFFIDSFVNALMVDLYVPGDKGKEVYASPLLASHFDGLPPACTFLLPPLPIPPLP
jgi:acetyl esterase/lipase